MPRKKSNPRPSLAGSEAAHFRILGSRAAAVFAKHDGRSIIDVKAIKGGARVTVTSDLPLPPEHKPAEPVTEFRAGLYQHYKGGFYQALGVAAHSETEELMVVYVSLDASKAGPRLRVRPLSMWADLVVDENKTTQKRFRYVGLSLTK